MNRQTTQFKQSRYEKIPKSIVFGRFLLIFASVAYFFISILLIVYFGVDVGMGYINWTEPLQCLAGTFSLPLAIFLIYAGSAGFCYVRNKGKLLPIASFAAVFGAIFVILDVTLYCFLYRDGFPATRLALRLGTVDASILIYFFGWLLAKNYLD